MTTRIQLKQIPFCLFLSIGMLFSIVSCNNSPYRATNKLHKKQARLLSKRIVSAPIDSILALTGKSATSWVGTVNFGIRKPNFVIIHHTAQDACEQTLKTFTLEKTQVSAHYLICKDGTTQQLLSDYLRAWHAGNGKWGSITDINSVSLGIELDNNGFEPFPNEQIQSLLLLLGGLKKLHNIPTANFIGHADIAVTRKVDPSIFFPWKELSEKGFGNWYSDTTAVQVPEPFDPLLALRIIGYDISQPDAATQAFRRHFISSNATGKLVDEELKILYSLMLKAL